MLAMIVQERNDPGTAATIGMYLFCFVHVATSINRIIEKVSENGK